MPTPPIGKRIHVTGNVASGKSTLAHRLAEALDAPLVELDALNWLPGWVGLNKTDPDEFEQRIREATGGERWVVAGSYGRFSRRIIWPRLDTVIWLDLPMPVLAWRALRRSWKRWRTGELLWGTNRERFWPQLMIWRKEDSLLGWLITQHARKRRDMLERLADPRWGHIRFVRLRSAREVERAIRRLAQMGQPATLTERKSMTDRYDAYDPLALPSAEEGPSTVDDVAAGPGGADHSSHLMRHDIRRRGVGNGRPD